MAMFTRKFESAKHDWETPQDLFESYDKEFHFTLDGAASALNTKVRSAFFTAETDGLASEWGRHTVWLNPPYGEGKAPIKAWINHAYEQSLTGATSVVLIPARTNTNWFHDVCLRHGEVRFIRGRPKFGGAVHGLPQPLCVVIFRAK